MARFSLACDTGVMTAARVYREIDATREVLGSERRCPLNRQPARVRPGPLRMANGLV